MKIVRMTMVAALVAAFGIIGCKSTSEPNEVRRIGMIDGSAAGIIPAIVVPDTVQEGTSFAVEVTTFDVAYCSRVAETEVVAGTNSFTVTPWNYVRTDLDCPRMYQALVHEALLDAGAAGELTIEIVGRNADTGELVSVERIVVVSPAAGEDSATPG